MRFTITNTITYDVEEQLFYDLLKQENITVEDYKKVVCNDFKFDKYKCHLLFMFNYSPF